jgi:hypothetical protein
MEDLAEVEATEVLEAEVTGIVSVITDIIIIVVWVRVVCIIIMHIIMEAEILTL